MFTASFGARNDFRNEDNVMEKKTYAKEQKLPKREQDKVQALKKNRLQTVPHKENILGTQKTWKLLCYLTGILAPVSLIGLAFYGVYLWAAASAAGPMGQELFISFEVAGEPAYLFKATVTCAIIGLILFAAFGISCIVLSILYKKKYKKPESPKVSH